MSKSELIKQIGAMNLRNARLACTMDSKVRNVVRNSTRISDMLELYTQTSESVNKNMGFLVRSVRGK